MSSWFVRPADYVDLMMLLVGYRGIVCPYCRVIGRLVGWCVGFLGRDDAACSRGTSFPAPSEVPLLDLTPTSMLTPLAPLAASSLLGYVLMPRVWEAARSW